MSKDLIPLKLHKYVVTLTIIIRKCQLQVCDIRLENHAHLITFSLNIFLTSFIDLLHHIFGIVTKQTDQKR